MRKRLPVNANYLDDYQGNSHLYLNSCRNILKGGFGAAIGVGGAIQTPLGSFALGEGQSVAVGK